MSDRYDYIVVGGGSAGCVIASRLSEDPQQRVLVLEAGRPDYKWDVFIHMPGAFSIPIGKKWYDWMYESEPEPHMGGRRIYHARGKVLGGSSSINGMIFQRGNPLDYARWAAEPGMADWDYRHCLPYFKKMEDCLAGGDEYRGDSGPLILERGAASTPLHDAFFTAVQQAGYPLTDDVNGFRQEGFARFDRNIYRGRRLSAARAYLHPVLHRPNLDVETGALVERIRFQDGAAVGVTYRKKGRRFAPDATEVVLCGGAINTPQLLQVSGVGPASHLARLGIDVVADAPGVGGNLQDHLEVYVQYAAAEPVSMYPALLWRNRPLIGLKWLLRRTGAAATNHFEAGGFIRSNDDAAYPNLMVHFLPLAVRYDGTVPGGGGHGYQLHIGPMYSNSVGSVMVKSAEIDAKPALRFNYLSTAQDREEWIEAVGHARRILNQPAFDPFNGGELAPGPEVQTGDEILEWVARDAETALHPCGTARMGTGPDAVVDPNDFSVHGVSRLRVVDASVMPFVTNGNIYAPVMMLAERAADAIRGKDLLAPIDVDFYRHGRSDNHRSGNGTGPDGVTS